VEQQHASAWPTRLSTAGVAASVAVLLSWATAFGGDRATFIRDGLELAPAGDKVGHLLLYGALALSLGWAIHRWRPRVWIITGPTIAWTVGFIDEVRQKGIQGRDADFEDLLANSLGVTLAFGLLFALQSVKRE